MAIVVTVPTVLLTRPTAQSTTIAEPNTSSAIPSTVIVTSTLEATTTNTTSTVETTTTNTTSTVETTTANTTSTVETTTANTTSTVETTTANTTSTVETTTANTTSTVETTTADTTSTVTSTITETAETPMRGTDVALTPQALWSPNGTTVAGGHDVGEELNQLNRPHGLYVDENQTVYVADLGNHRIVAWPAGATSGQVVAGGNGPGNQSFKSSGLFYPCGRRWNNDLLYKINPYTSQCKLFLNRFYQGDSF
ncbi:unnamed protein product [Rotaria sp. Silwood2]|nr:unnamed protein product [Rotaria sp. Silwood2]